MPSGALSIHHQDKPDASCNDTLLIPDIGYTRDHLIEGVREALSFHHHFLQTAKTSPECGLIGVPTPEWAPRFLRGKTIPEAVVEKAGSLTFSKRRPDNVAPFLHYVSTACANQTPLLFRVAFGPLKNVNCCDHHQSPDLAEYLALIQLARLITAIAAIYPHGIKVQIVPDDLRARKANLCPVDYTQTYIAGLKTLAQRLSFSDWLDVENGESRLYDLYNVEHYQERAEQELQKRKLDDPDRYAARWQSALENAEKNVASSLIHGQITDISSAAWRYLVAHQAEILSGLWSPRDAFPLVYANHPGTYQIYSLGYKKTKLPWQICLPLNLLGGTGLEQHIEQEATF